MAELADCSPWAAEWLLASRAARVSEKVGESLRNVAGIWFGGESEDPWPAGFAGYFNSADSRLLKTAVVLSRFFPPGMWEPQPFPREIYSFDDLPDSQLIDAKQFVQPADVDSDYDSSRDLGVDVVSIVKFVVQQVAGESKALVPLTNSPIATPLQLSAATVEQYERMLWACRRTRIEWAEASLRERMGGLFDSLQLRARTALLGVEVDLMDDFHPDPSRTMHGLCAAFEQELRQNFLARLAEFVNNRRPGSKFPAKNSVIENFRVTEEASMGDVLRALRETDSLWEDFFSWAGLDRAALKRVIKEVQNQRNSVAHGNSISRQDVIEYQRNWLNPSSGVFAVLMGRRNNVI